jgi:hypothetical protein
MRRVLAGTLALAAALAAPTAFGCADGGCEVSWKLAAQEMDCASRATLAPGNDTRVNMLLLLRDRGGLDTAALKPVEVEYSYDDGGETFYSWRNLNAGLFPGRYDYWTGFGGKEGDRRGSRCLSLAGGDVGFAAALAANRSVPAGERTALNAARARLVPACDGEAVGSATWPSVSSAAGQQFLAYLQAAEEFYREDFDSARQHYSVLTTTSDPWVAETASYMVPRVLLNEALAKSVDEYGWFKGVKDVNQPAVRAAGAGLNAYLKAYPAGRYAGSAQGLTRRVAWLAGDRTGLARTYAGLLSKVDPGAESATVLVEEIDNKLIASPDQEAVADGPLLLATLDLMRMRPSYGADGEGPPLLTAAELEGQASKFASDRPLFDYLRATHAFYVAKDYRKVLALVPDDAKQGRYSNLGFSRQVLRGMALAALKDRNEGGFWQELLSGAKGGWQRSTVQLGLALNWERSGKVDAVFAPGSPISDPSIRSILIVNSAGAPLLRRIVQDRANPVKERDNALYTLLENELIHGQFAAFAGDTKLPVADPASSAAAFTTGKVADGYPCAPIAVTAAALAKLPQDIPGRLCLGDFFRINGLDAPNFGETPESDKPTDVLGSFAHGFTGARINRSEIYNSVIANSRAAPNDKAYALYRAVMCYSPSAYNSCGGENVEIAQRKAWFNQLKRDYPASQWAKKLRYYW